MLKEAVLQRLKALGGNISELQGTTLFEVLSSITFDSVLYLKPEDTPWAMGEEEEPIYGLGDFIDQHTNLIKSNREELYQKIIDNFYQITEGSYGQLFWEPKMFTPFAEGSEDYIEWNDLFIDPDEVKLQVISDYIGTKTPDFILLATSYGYPSEYYLCSDDPNTDNPQVFGTDHTEFFQDVSDEGQLLQFLENCMTPEELIVLVDKALNKMEK